MFMQCIIKPNQIIYIYIYLGNILLLQGCDVIGSREWYRTQLMLKSKNIWWVKLKFRSEKGKRIRIFFFWGEEKDSKARICLYVAKHMLKPSNPGRTITTTENK